MSDPNTSTQANPITSRKKRERERRAHKRAQEKEKREVREGHPCGCRARSRRETAVTCLGVSHGLWVGASAHASGVVATGLQVHVRLVNLAGLRHLDVVEGLRHGATAALARTAPLRQHGAGDLRRGAVHVLLQRVGADVLEVAHDRVAVLVDIHVAVRVQAPLAVTVDAGRPHRHVLGIHVLMRVEPTPVTHLALRLLLGAVHLLRHRLRPRGRARLANLLVVLLMAHHVRLANALAQHHLEQRRLLHRLPRRAAAVDDDAEEDHQDDDGHDEEENPPVLLRPRQILEAVDEDRLRHAGGRRLQNRVELHLTHHHEAGLRVEVAGGPLRVAVHGVQQLHVAVRRADAVVVAAREGVPLGVLGGVPVDLAKLVQLLGRGVARLVQPRPVRRADLVVVRVHRVVTVGPAVVAVQTVRRLRRIIHAVDALVGVRRGRHRRGAGEEHAGECAAVLPHVVQDVRVDEVVRLTRRHAAAVEARRLG